MQKDFYAILKIKVTVRYQTVTFHYIFRTVDPFTVEPSFDGISSFFAYDTQLRKSCN